MIYCIAVAILICLTYLEWCGKGNTILGDKNIEKYCYVFVATMLTLVAALRYETGVDWQYYVPFYKICLGNPVGYNYEAGYRIINMIFRVLCNDYYVLQFVVSVVCGYVIFSYLYKKSERPLFTLTLYFLFSYFFWINMAIQRQEIAMTIIILGMRFVEQKRLGLWVLTILLAMQFHITSLVAFPLYFTTGYKINRRTAIAIYIFATVLEAIGFVVIRQIIYYIQICPVLPERINSIAKAYWTNEHGVRYGYRTIYSFIGNNIFYLLVVFLYKPKRDNYILNFLMGLLCINIGRNFSVVGRCAYYYMLCGCGLISYNAIADRKILIGKKRFSKRTERILSLCLVTFTLIVFCYVTYLMFYNDVPTAVAFKQGFLPYRNSIFR